MLAEKAGALVHSLTTVGLRRPRLLLAPGTGTSLLFTRLSSPTGGHFSWVVVFLPVPRAGKTHFVPRVGVSLSHVGCMLYNALLNY